MFECHPAPPTSPAEGDARLVTFAFSIKIHIGDGRQNVPWRPRIGLCLSSSPSWVATTHMPREQLHNRGDAGKTQERWVWQHMRRMIWGQTITHHEKAHSGMRAPYKHARDASWCSMQRACMHDAHHASCMRTWAIREALLPLGRNYWSMCVQSSQVTLIITLCKPCPLAE